MPIFEATPGNPALLVLASAALGIAVGVGLFMLMRVLPRGLEPVEGMIAEAQLALKRERSEESSRLFGVVSAVLPAVARVTRRLPLEAVKRDVVKAYARAGWPGGLSDDELMALTIVIAIVLSLILAGAAALYDPVFAPAGLLGLLVAPGLMTSKLTAQGKARDNAIIRVMPFVLDLLVLSLRAGASLTIAMERVAQDYAGHPLGEEFRATLKDIEMGTTAKQAFTNLAGRVPSIVVRAFVDEVIQSEELGRPIADTLERLSDRVRINRVQDATTAAGRAKVLVLAPGVLVLLASLIVLFSPWIVRFKEAGVADMM